MKNEKGKMISLCLLIFIFVSVGTIKIREALVDYIVAEKKDRVEELLDYYQDILLSRLKYEFNTAKDIAQNISNNPDDLNAFEKIAEELMKEKQITYVSLIKDNTILYALPKDIYGSQAGDSLKQYPYVFNLPKLLKDTVIEGPKDFFGDGNESFLYLEPLFQDGSYWGEVAVCIDRTATAEAFGLERLAKNEYEYELWKIDSQDGHKQVVSVSDASFDFSHGMSMNFDMSGQWTLNIMPREGWIGRSDNILITIFCGFAGLLLMSCFLLCLRVWWFSNGRKMQKYMDLQSGMFNTEGFEKEIESWVKDGVPSFAVIYFVVNGYNQMVHVLSEKEKKEYLAKVKRGTESIIESKYVLGRMGEGNFCVAVLDDMNEHAIDGLAKSLCMEMIWKKKYEDKKLFLNTDYQFVRYPNDGVNAEELWGKVTKDYFIRVEEESPAVSLTEKCAALIRGENDVKFEEYSDINMMRLSKTIHQYSKKVEQLIYEDSVYHVGNRSKYNRDVKMLISYDKKRKLTFYCIDICSFSKYNMLFSIDTGDAILKEASRRLRTLFKEYLYRINGDVFLGILHGGDRIEETVDKMFERMQEPVQISGQKLVLDIKCGICVYPQHGETPEELLEFVQTALRYAKKQEKERTIIYDENLAKVLREEVEILKNQTDLEI